jgi:general secretion pathway protein D
VRSGGSVTGSGLPILGDTRIVSYERNNEVVLFGKKKQIALAKTIITQLDRVQKQVLIEAIIIDVALGENKSFGASIRQAKQGFGGNSPNGGLSGALASALGPAGFSPTTIGDAASGFSYYGFLGNNWEVAVRALETDTRVDMLSTPRIQTSHAEQASLFIGEERPVVTGTFSDISGGQNAQIQMRQIGITLEILPFINDEGLVVMDIYQRIQDIVGSQTIDGNDIPITTDRSANSKVAVRDGEMIMLGGFVKTKKTFTKEGVPFLRHIPILGKLFENTTESDERFELIILLRPTVLPTPAAAHAKALELSTGLPGIDGAKQVEKHIEEKWRFLRGIEKKQLEKDALKFRLPRPDANQGNLKNLPLIPQLPPRPPKKD